ncbi:M13-type metalloendopeptidase, partial [Mycoplasmopsis bovis]|uniref:M13-type metalloendopeptidase n=1 Tax=Mycoplasmopsis bovis TaxID=28903 RepID=UPI003D2D9B9E
DANDIKDFFTSFAVIWKSKYKPESARLLLATDVHAPAKLRKSAVLLQAITGIKSVTSLSLV